MEPVAGPGVSANPRRQKVHPLRAVEQKDAPAACTARRRVYPVAVKKPGIGLEHGQVMFDVLQTHPSIRDDVIEVLHQQCLGEDRERLECGLLQAGA